MPSLTACTPALLLLLQHILLLVAYCLLFNPCCRWAITSDDPKFRGTGNKDSGDDYEAAPGEHWAHSQWEEACWEEAC